jgi:hypothetical protein
MRRGLALVFVCGCVWPGAPRPDPPTTALKPLAGPLGPDAVGLLVAVLEVPVGDKAANGPMWTAIDEQAVALDRRAALDDNGFRVGVVGLRPDGLDDLLNSPRSNPNPRWVQMRAGHARALPLGGSRPLCQFVVVAGGTPGPPVAFEQAQCAIQVTPTLTPNDSIKLSFVPVVRHGIRSPWSAPVGDGDADPPGERYPDLGWEVTPTAKEMVVVGTHFAKAGTLGHACFVEPDPLKPVQRLLVVQAVRPANPEGVGTGQ